MGFVDRTALEGYSTFTVFEGQRKALEMLMWLYRIIGFAINI